MKDKHPNNWILAFYGFIGLGFIVSLTVFTTILTIWILSKF